MSSRIPLPTTEEMMLSPRRLKSMLYFCGLVFLVSSNSCWQRVSSFSTRLPSSCGSTAHNNDNRSNHQQIQIQQEAINCYQRSSSILILAAESSSSSSVSSPETTTTAEEIQVLFSKYCDEDRLISKKTIESMPPFDDMLVRIPFSTSFSVVLGRNIISYIILCKKSRILFYFICEECLLAGRGR
jgi:hypothetical protein